ncbi:MAG TPA: hypothetical protein PK079_05180 [Leptospiraceae bacterium]|nr:hypothetical protein [Leptospiraceae bacterium]HMW06264.1 hypothetical protein [Leptospiraceae bacterium]HMX33175.1 hypothetical protein [Leptospiraceae bacterium]HMY31726.1 hypothetical protein [Leptospiraceae bacterium]HMZ64519.1 hypothetical protein [Leptospiraceae bacterium]
MIVSSFAIWNIDFKHSSLSSDNRIWKLPSKELKEVILYYFLFAILLFVFVAGGFVVTTEFLNGLSDIFHWNLVDAYRDAPEKFLFRLLVTIVTPLAFLGIYFWPILLSLRSSFRIQAEAGKLFCGKKTFRLIDDAKMQLRKMRHVTRHGSGIAKIRKAHILVEWKVEDKKGDSHLIVFSEESFDELSNFFQHVARVSGIPLDLVTNP